MSENRPVGLEAMQPYLEEAQSLFSRVQEVRVRTLKSGRAVRKYLAFLAYMTSCYCTASVHAKNLTDAENLMAEARKVAELSDWFLNYVARQEAKWLCFEFGNA